MKTRKYIFSILAVMLVLASCSTKKNTSLTRFWHSFTARYNIYYNGAQAYIDGSLEKEKGNKDNYTERIPLYTVSNKGSRELGKGHYETAITKAEKAIQLHSIKAKPEWNKERRKTEQDIEWLSRKEYNPFLWRAWMLMGRSQFYKGSFDEAAATFSYMSRLYKGQPSIYGKARAWLAKCYIENDWIYDAEDVIRNMMRDSIDWRAQKEWDYTLCDYYLHTDNLPEATKYLRRVISHEMRRKQKAREYFLLGQLEAAQGHKKEAYEAFRKVTRQNPPYELDFNARISMTEVMAEGQSKKMISRLRRMAHNDNNKDYLDQVYYAIGNIYLAEKDTANAIAAYEKGNEKATRSGIEKGVLLLKLGDLYWIKEKYNDAQRCYGEAIGLLDKERKDYEELSKRSKILDELVPYTDAIHLQDSLQELAKMPEKERLAAIDRVIEELKKKEKEERKKAQEAEVEKAQQKQGSVGNRNQRPTPTTPQPAAKDGQWYFYNQMTVNQGKQTFQKQWGKRENADDWRRANKTVVGNLNMPDDAEVPDSLESLSNPDNLELTDSLESLSEDSIAAVDDSLANDPHNREYYLAQIPFTEEQKASSDAIIMDGLYNAGVIFKDKLENFGLARKELTRLTFQYPEYEQMDKAWYHLFLLYSRTGETALADSCLENMKTNYPESELTILLSDPYFEENARFGEHLEDSIYAVTYEAFKEGRHDVISQNAQLTAERFPLGENRPKFIFINGLSLLNQGDAKGCVSELKTVVEKYPKSEVAEMAGMIIKGVQEGRTLSGGTFDIDDFWSRRDVTLAQDSTSTDTLSADRNVPFLFMLVYQPDSINENQLLYEMARFNFSNFLVRNFDLEIERQQGFCRMLIRGFLSFDEALQYARQLYSADNMLKVLKPCRSLVISEHNLTFIGSRYSYKDYEEYYEKTFSPLQISNEELLKIPTDFKQRDPEDAEAEEEEEEEADDDDDFDLW